jgi:hypothetical protein
MKIGNLLGALLVIGFYCWIDVRRILPFNDIKEIGSPSGKSLICQLIEMEPKNFHEIENRGRRWIDCLFMKVKLALI